MIITLKNQSGCSFTFDDIPELDTGDKVKEYLLTDPATSHFFKSKEDLDQNWEVTSSKQQAIDETVPHCDIEEATSNKQ